MHDLTARSRWTPRLATLLLLACLLSGCSSWQPARGALPPESGFAAAESTVLGRLAGATGADGTAGTGGTGGTAGTGGTGGTAPDRVRVLDSGRDALIERAALIEAAERAIDAQYYIWNSDDSGRYLASRLYAAAERGVQVRLLLDDVNLAGRDAALAALDAHPNIAIRVYNPFDGRKGLARLGDMVFDFARINRRMHSKSLTVDGAMTIVGGRNIGDEYFDAHAQFNFRDRDVVAAGPVVAATAAMFDQFWNSPLSRPAAELAPGPTAPPAGAADAVAAATARLSALHGALPQSPADGLRALQRSLAQALPARARLVHDAPPEPARLAATDQPQPSSDALGKEIASVRGEILIESAYLVMDDATMTRVRTLRGHGIAVRALTNSLASNDVTANHAAYARRRVRMLESGVELFELRPDAPSCTDLVMNPAACGAGHQFGLHSKTFVFDRATVYVGSFNLNLRSRYLNAESGMLIESPALAAQVAAAIETNMAPANSWQVTLDQRGAPLWLARGEGSLARPVRAEPQAPWLRRATSGFIALFPLEKYL